MNNPQKLQVGSKIWFFDENRRTYPAPVPGKPFVNAAPIYREHWRLVEIKGENRRSWLTDRGKCPKTGPHRGWAFSEAEVEDSCWVHEHRYEIGRLVVSCRDPALLRQIAKLLDYDSQRAPSR